MQKFKPYLLGVSFGVLAFTGVALATKDYTPKPKINVCHKTSSETNPYNAIRVAEEGYLNGHPDDFLYTGPVDDKGKPDKEAGDKWCEDNVPQPPVVTPVPDPTPAPTTPQSAQPAPKTLPETGGSF